MKKKSIMLVSVTAAIAGILGLTFAVQGNIGNPLHTVFGDGSTYTTTLTDGSALSSKTGLNNTIAYTATSLTGGSASAIGTLAKGGTLNNTTRLTGLSQLVITMTSGSIDIYTSWDSATFTHSAVDSLIASGTVKFTDTPNYFKIVARADTVLTSIQATFACGTATTDPFTTAITTAAELNAMSASGHYYLANDIDITSTLGTTVADFAGVLDGMGYKIYATSGFGNSDRGAIFSGTTSGAIRNLNVSVNLEDGASYNSAFAWKLDGASLKDLNVFTSYGGTATYSGGLCCYLNGATIKDTNVYLSTPTFSSDTDKVGGLCVRLEPGISMTNVKVLCPAETTLTNLRAYGFLDGSFTPDLSGVTIDHDGSERLLSNPFYQDYSGGLQTTLGTLSASTHNGQPYYTRSITSSNSNKLFNRVFDIRLYKEIRLSVRSDYDVSLVGSGAIYASANAWVNIDILQTDDGVFTATACRSGKACAVVTGLTDHTLGQMFAFITSNTESHTFDATGIYLVKSHGTQIASSAFASATAQNSSLITATAAVTGGSDLDLFNNVTVSGYSDIRFSILPDDTDRVDHSISFIKGAGLGGNTLIYAESWSYFHLVKASGKWTLTIDWINYDNFTYTTNTASGLEGDTLNALFVVNSNVNLASISSTPVFAA